MDIDKLQGKEVYVNGSSAYQNAFTIEEMLTIYMALEKMKDDFQEGINCFPYAKRLSNEEIYFINNSKKFISLANISMGKIDKTFKAIGIDLKESDIGI